MKKAGAAGVGFVVPEGDFFLNIDDATLDDPRVLESILTNKNIRVRHSCKRPTPWIF